MARVKRGITAHQKHKKIFAATKGFRHGRKNVFRQAKQAFLKAGTNRYRGLKLKKRVARRSWISTLSAALVQYDIRYNIFIHYLGKLDIKLDRKVLAELAQKYPVEFEKIVLKVKAAVR
jgi:large subunit ribosomal protein L20